MYNTGNYQDIYTFYRDFVNKSRTTLETILKGSDDDYVKFLRKNLEICIKNYKIVRDVANKIVSMRDNSELIKNLKIEYKYHNQDMIDSAFKKAISYAERLYYGLGEDFIKNMNLSSSYNDIYDAECELNSMLSVFMSNYTEIRDKKYIPTLTF
ncbi:MAG: hypothetical protein BJBARM5_0498 [Candidatus Parvarchaeum acidophilus ARMAN-5]|jgi:hypothetical protein|uniref:Uncharacterized protein n=1 Tax=Candidatus Parvarchaeum acidophilus ARMAN-5 TaxID=662762 RepID=D6GVI5_PARA5|nr:MAG: hypothetical protein BJBARM5_0498 [Candidatus Parvarchaeum acidophilus ARMAN-5]